MFIWAEVISVSERTFQQVIYFCSVRLEKCYPASSPGKVSCCDVDFVTRQNFFPGKLGPYGKKIISVIQNSPVSKQDLVKRSVPRRELACKLVEIFSR